MNKIFAYLLAATLCICIATGCELRNSGALDSDPVDETTSEADVTESEETEITSVTETEGETESSTAESTEAVTTTAETTATTTAAVTTVTTAPSAKAPATQKYIDMIKNENFYYSYTHIASSNDEAPAYTQKAPNSYYAFCYDNGNSYLHMASNEGSSLFLTKVIKNDGTKYVKASDGVYESKASKNEMDFSNVLIWELRPALNCTYTSSGIESFAGSQADYDLYTSPDGSELKIFHNNGNIIGIVSKIKNSSGAFEDMHMVIERFTTKIPDDIFTLS